jgi:hypothetical protein
MNSQSASAAGATAFDPAASPAHDSALVPAWSAGLPPYAIGSAAAFWALQRIATFWPAGRALRHAYDDGILICMGAAERTTLNIDRAALAKASALTGVTEKTALVRMGLEALIARASAERLASLGGSEPRLRAIPRRRRR